MGRGYWNWLFALPLATLDHGRSEPGINTISVTKSVTFGVTVRAAHTPAQARSAVRRVSRLVARLGKKCRRIDPTTIATFPLPCN
ncbi:hypothetical protein B0G71_2862 [Paraburkholderia sp. BL27I4N3]|nr:hypothetical protein B0G71_2862 [Paraburkholderia sp. BL27I4N3]